MGKRKSMCISTQDISQRLPLSLLLTSHCQNLVTWSDIPRRRFKNVIITWLVMCSIKISTTIKLGKYKFQALPRYTKKTMVKHSSLKISETHITNFREIFNTCIIHWNKFIVQMQALSFSWMELEKNYGHKNYNNDNNRFTLK